MRQIRRAGAIIPLLLLVAGVLVGCTIEPGNDAFFRIENETGERVVLTSRSEQTEPTPRPFRTLEPGQVDQGGLGEECRKNSSVTAVTPSGRTFTFGPPICRGDYWPIGRK